MTTFRYVAIKSQGSRQKGVIDASNIQEAKEKLRAQGVLVLKIFESKRIFSARKKDLKSSDVIAFTIQLKELLQAGIPLFESLLSLEEMHQGEGSHFLFKSLPDDIKKGNPLSTALKKFPTSFSPLYIALVRAGEAVGKLDHALEKLSLLLDKREKLRKKIVSSLIYPSFLMAFSFFVIGALLLFVVPSLEALFEGREVNGFTKMVFSFSHFITDKYPYYLLLGVLIGGYALYCVKKKKELVQRICLQIPLMNKVLVEGALARFSRTLATLLEGGITLKEGLEMARGTLGVLMLERVISDAERSIVEGGVLSHELKKSMLIPPLVVRMVTIGEESGNLFHMLHKVAEFYEDEVDKRCSRLLALSGPVILLIMGLFVGIIMMAVLLPMTDASIFIN